MGWIVVRNWDRFQHYGDRQPPWIKLYVALLHDDGFQGLGPADRSALVGIWMLYAMTRRSVRDQPAVVSRAIGQRVTVATLKRLNHAGFIDISASKPLAPDARAIETDVDVDNPPTPLKRETPEPPLPVVTAPGRRKSPTGARFTAAENWIRNGAAAEVPVGHLAEVFADEFKITDPELVQTLVERVSEWRTP